MKLIRVRLYELNNCSKINGTKVRGTGNLMGFRYPCSKLSFQVFTESTFLSQLIWIITTLKNSFIVTYMECGEPNAPVIPLSQRLTTRLSPSYLGKCKITLLKGGFTIPKILGNIHQNYLKLKAGYKVIS